MKYTIVDGQAIYEGPTEDYILSNVELTLRLKNGTPAELFSSKNGLLIEFSKNDLPNPVSSRLWPNGCEFSHEKTTWSFFTSPWIRSMLWELNGLERLVLSFKAPLEKRFKVPFGPTYSFKKLLNVIVEGSKIDLSNLVRIEVLEGRIEDLQRKDETFTLKLSAKNKKLKLRFCTRKEIVDERVENLSYNRFLKDHVPKNLNHLKESLALFALHTALSNWKDLGKTNAFVAGVNYSFPPRTYFRDSFWTCLSVLNVRADLVRDQILTLSSAVHDDGCPSGVMFLEDEEKMLLAQLKKENPILAASVRYENDWWSDHHDSGFLFVLLVSKYVESTQDLSILKERVDSETVIERIVKILRHSEKFIENDLYKKPHDCLDWADNVFRDGFVTYDAALHAAAMREASKLLRMMDMEEESSFWENRYLATRRSFNEVLFDERKGHFVDFIGSYVEDHLALDTVVSIILDVADEDKARSTLLRMEKLLETRNNSAQPYGDWGVMTVWPHYRRRSHLFGKSAFPYRYHNGGCWPYLSSIYALAKAKYGLDHEYPLLSWWKYSLENGWVNLVEYYSPCYPRGSLHQAWSSYTFAVVSQIK